MGWAMFELGEVMGARGNVKAKKLKDGGTLYCCVTAAAAVDFGTLHLQLRGLDLGKHSGILRGKPDPFFVLSSQASQGGGNRIWYPAYRSEVLQSQASPAEWKGLDISMEKICGGERDRPILVEVYNYKKAGNHQIIGKFQTTVNGFMGAHQCTQGLGLEYHGQTNGQIIVVEAKAIGGKLSSTSTPMQLSASLPPQLSSPVVPIAAGVAASCPPSSAPVPEWTPDYSRPYLSESPISSSGPALPPPGSALPPALLPPAFDISDGPAYDPHATLQGTKKVPKFVDYLAGGLEINLSVAIDFTGSNGDPCLEGTLHYRCPNGEQLNDYEKALTAVGSIVARYDSDQRFPVLGFGAKNKNEIQHCFQVGTSSESIGIHGVLESYRSVFSTGLVMSGPMVFEEVIRHSALNAQRKWKENRAIGKQSYEILLILTDGAVTDVDQTRAAIKLACSSPLSIIIVGVGNDDFSSMRFLDHAHEDDIDMRDIVQFVEFSKYRDDRQALTKETLDGIPDQVVDYFYKRKRVMPLAAMSASQMDIVEEEHNSEYDFDLSVNVEEDGSIHLADGRQATWDATSYGTAAAFLPPATRPPTFNPSITSNSASLSASSAWTPSHSGHAPSSYCISKPASSVYIPLRSGHAPSTYSLTPPVSPGIHTNYGPYNQSTATVTQGVQTSRITTSTLTPYATPPVSPLRFTPYVNQSP